MKASSDLKFCSCRLCRWGKHTKAGGHYVRSVRRAYRHRVKQLLKQGKYDSIPTKCGVAYTD